MYATLRNIPYGFSMLILALRISDKHMKMFCKVACLSDWSFMYNAWSVLYLNLSFIFYN